MCVSWAVQSQDTLFTTQITQKYELINIKNQFNKDFDAYPQNNPLLLNLVSKQKFYVCNNEEREIRWYFKIGTSSIFLQSSSDIVRANSGLNAWMQAKVTDSKNHQITQQNGFLVPITERVILGDMQSFQFDFKPKQCYQVEILFFEPSHRKASTEIKILTSEGFLASQQDYQAKTVISDFVSVAFIGVLLIMIFFTLAIFSQNRFPEFAYYALYLLAVLAFEVIAEYPFKFNQFFIWQYPEHWLHAKEISVYGYLIFYHYFLFQFLGLSHKNPLMYRILSAMNWIYYMMILVNSLALIFVSLDAQYQLFIINSWIFYFTFPIYAYLIFTLWKLRGVPFSKYIFFGSLCFYLGNVLSALAEIFVNQEIYLYPNNLMQLGTSGEILFFSVALGRKLLLDSEEKNRLQKESIKQLEEKEKFIREINEKLAQDVQEKTEEILAQDRNLQEEKEEKMQVQFQQQLGEMQLYALQTQLNPHFLFNCLNTIKSLILNQKNEQASIYLGRFAALMRLTLENSSKLKINLQQSMDYLRTYIEIEQLRFKEDFHYEISFDGEEDPALLDVPPMLIQPFVENAILHGLVSIQETKKLILRFVETDDYLECSIEDNGVGFPENTKESKHQSRGMEMIQKYFDLWNKHHQAKAGFEIIHKALLTPAQKGTIILIKIPI
jgi:sensor histidine kinase YesM